MRHPKKGKIFLDKINIRSEDIRSQTAKIAKSLNDFQMPLPREQVRIRTQTQLNLISIILKLAHLHELIDELTIATYTLNKETFQGLKKLMI